MSDYNVIDTDVEAIMKESFIQYSMAVIVSRALPDVRDGLKPVHRRILYTMYENGLTPDQAYRKCADTVGSVLGKYHPHGDASVYDALVRLAQKFSMRYPLVDGHGNFGSVDGDPPAAYRYTEAKMAKMSVNMLTDINKTTVDFQSNYDDRLKEPVVLPSRFPNLLCNGSVGIAVGMATNIPPHNLHEVIEGMKTVMKNPDCTLDELMQSIKGPDFPTYSKFIFYDSLFESCEQPASKHHTGDGHRSNGQGCRGKCPVSQYLKYNDNHIFYLISDGERSLYDRCPRFKSRGYGYWLSIVLSAIWLALYTGSDRLQLFDVMDSI